MIELRGTSAVGVYRVIKAEQSNCSDKGEFHGQVDALVFSTFNARG